MGKSTDSPKSTDPMGFEDENSNFDIFTLFAYNKICLSENIESF